MPAIHLCRPLCGLVIEVRSVPRVPLRFTRGYKPSPASRAGHAKVPEVLGRARSPRFNYTPAAQAFTPGSRAPTNQIARFTRLWFGLKAILHDEMRLSKAKAA